MTLGIKLACGESVTKQNFVLLCSVGCVLLTGIEYLFDIRTTLAISGVAFHPSQDSNTYDLYLTSVDKGDVLFVSLQSGEVEAISGKVFSSLHFYRLSI